MQPTRFLEAEHQVILRALACLEAMLQGDVELPHAKMAELLDFFRSYADHCHHGKEEDLLFPAMEARGLTPDRGPTAVMRDEHEFGREAVRRMVDAAERGLEGPLREAGATFLDFLRAHIAKENHILFPLADQMLDEEALNELGARFDAFEARDFGPEFHERYEGFILALARELNVDQERYEVAPACGGR